MTRDIFLEAVNRRVRDEAGEILARLHCDDALDMVSEGKRLRALLMYGLAEDPNETLITAATAVELFHASTLVHDDIIDNATTRRNQPTISYKHSLGTAIMVGDALFARASELARQSMTPELQAEFHELYVQIAEAQNNELLWRGRLRSEETYYEICHGKTGLLYQFAVRVGLGKTEVGNLYEDVVSKIAYAFQIVDDIDDTVMWRGESDAHASKLAEFDIDLGNVTLPTIVAFGRRGVTSETFAGMKQIEALTEDDWQYGIKESRERAAKLVAESRDLLEKIPSSHRHEQFAAWAEPMMRQLETKSMTIDNLKI